VLGKKRAKEVLFCSACGSRVESRWIDSSYPPKGEILIRDCSSPQSYIDSGHYFALTGKKRVKLPKFDPYTGEPYGS